MTIINNILGPIARQGLNMLSLRRLPQIDGELTLPGLSSQVEIIRDKWGIPHIYASNTHDLYYAQGFVHAQDRLFQMELNRRTAQGTLSAIFGEIALDTDRTTRTFGFNRLGLIDWNHVSNEMRETMIAYANGVNAFIDQPGRKLPVEFTLLNFQPDPWKPEDSMAFTRVMMWQLSHAWYSEIVRAKLIKKVGEEHAAELEINYPADNPICLPSGIEFNPHSLDEISANKNGPFLRQGLGSNGWAVARNKSDTASTYLCNDMHLPLGAPALWYGIHLIAEDINVTGASLPGVPLVLVGHNQHIAWGMTLAFTDCEDLFVEQFDPQNSKRYLFKDEWHDVETISEPIIVKGREEPHIEDIILTHHGPIISDVVGYPDQRIAINSMALRPCIAIQGWQLLNNARNWDEFVNAMQLIDAPQLNVPYADVHGNIGYWVTGKVPVRAQGDGRLPVPGWTGEYEWIGEVPFKEMPYAFNPKSGYIVNCNHRIIPDDYPHYLGEIWMNGYRALRIVDYFESKDRLTISDHKKMQGDFTCLPGVEFVSHLNAIDDLDPDIQLAVEILRDWDGQLTKDSVAGTIYEVTRYHMLRNILEPSLGEELTLEILGKGFHPILKSSNEFHGHDTVTLLQMLNNTESWWMGQAGGKETVIKSSLKQAIQWLRGNIGNHSSDWEWGKIHGAVFPHPLGLQKPLDHVFNRGPYPIGGDSDTPCQTAFHANDPYHNNAWAPSFRQIVNMEDLSQSLMIIPPGQSGQIGNKHYDDLISPWLECEYHPMLWTREQVEANTEGVLILNNTD